MGAPLPELKTVADLPAKVHCLILEILQLQMQVVHLQLLLCNSTTQTTTTTIVNSREGKLRHLYQISGNNVTYLLGLFSGILAVEMRQPVQSPDGRKQHQTFLLLSTDAILQRFLTCGILL